MVLFLKKFSLVFILLFFMILQGCENTTAPAGDDASSDIPGETLEKTIETVGAVDIVSETRRISAPVNIKNLPVECQEIRYLRFGLSGSTGDGSDADAVLVLMTGILVSNNVMSYLGKEMVSMAWIERGMRLEVWVPDRRYNSLEDLTGVDEAERTGDIDVALDYYYKGKSINGKTFSGYLNNRDVPYMAEMGLKMIMDDVYILITTLVPDRQVRRHKVFVGGHSLGGFLTAFFNGWDFDGNPATTDDAGYNNCAGIVGLDTILSPFINLFDPFIEMLPSVITAMIPTLAKGSYPIIVSGLKSNTLPRIIPLELMGFTAETYMLLELIGLEADIRPDEECTLFDRVDYSASVATLLRLVHSRSLLEFIQTTPSIENYRYTNQALLGVMLDDNFMPISICQASMGFPSSGTVSKKNFPMPDNLPEIPSLTDLMGILLSGDNLYIADNKSTLYTWNNYNEIGGAELAYTSGIKEVSDIHTIARCIYKGQSNLMEWYFPTRIIVDMLMATYPVSSKYGLNYMHGDKLASTPQFLSIAGDGPFYEPAKNAGIDVSAITAEGYDHFDTLTAATDDPERQNEVFLPLIDFMISNTDR